MDFVSEVRVVSNIHFDDYDLDALQVPRGMGYLWGIYVCFFLNVGPGGGIKLYMNDSE